MNSELHRHFPKNKIFRNWQSPELRALINYYRFREQGVVFTNGCFDLLHPGHVDLLLRAAELGDVLVVGLNSDASVQRLKGPHRPLMDESGRAAMLAALRCVDHVVCFGEDTPARLIEHIGPDVLVKGADYDPGDIAGADFVRKAGGQVLSLPLLEGYSTSLLVEKIKKK